MLSLLLALTAPLPTTVPTLAAPFSATAERSAVRLRLNGGDYWPGDRIKVEVEVAEDGYLVVFRVDADGLIRVLFPLDPDLDAFVQGGKRYELRGRGDRETFLADDQGGTGLIYAAVSREPMDLRRYAEGSHWDYVELKLQSDDPEAELSWFVRQFTSNAEFEYDVMGYRVYGPGGAGVTPVAVAGGGSYYDPYYYGSSYGYPRTGLNISIGSQFGGYYPYYSPYYDPWYGYGYGSYGYGSYGYNGYGYGGYGYSPYRHITVFPTRSHGVVSNPIYGVRSRPRAPLAGAGSFSDGVGTARIPSGGGRVSGGSGNDGNRDGVITSRPRAPQGEAQRPRSESGTPAAPGRSGGGSAGSAGRSAPTSTGRPTTPTPTPSPTDRGEGRSRRPTGSVAQVPSPPMTVRRTDERSLAPAASDRPAAGNRVGSRPTSRPTTSAASPESSPARSTPNRRAADRPVYRPPTAAPSASRTTGSGRSGERPAASSRPRQVDRPAPSTGRSSEKAGAPSRSERFERFERSDRTVRPSVNRQAGQADRPSRSEPSARSSPPTRSAPAARSTPAVRSAPSGRSAPSAPSARSAPSSSRGSSGGRSRGSID